MEGKPNHNIQGEDYGLKLHFLPRLTEPVLQILVEDKRKPTADAKPLNLHMLQGLEKQIAQIVLDASIERKVSLLAREFIHDMSVPIEQIPAPEDNTVAVNLTIPATISMQVLVMVLEVLGQEREIGNEPEEQ